MPAYAAARITASIHSAPVSQTPSTHTNPSTAVEPRGAATSTVHDFLDANNPPAQLVLVSAKKQTKNVTLFAFDLRNDGEGGATLIQNVTLEVSTSSPPQSPAANITDIVAKAIIKNEKGHIYGTGVLHTDNTISFTFSTPIKIAKGATQPFVVSIGLLPQKGNYAATGESLTSISEGTSITAINAKSGKADSVVGTAQGNRQTLSIYPGVNVVGADSAAVLTYNAADPSKSYGTFTIDAAVTALGGDIYIPRLISSTTENTQSGLILDLNLSHQAVGTTSLAASSTADVDPGNTSFWVIHAGDTETFSSVAYIDPSATDYYQVGLDALRFSTTDSDLNSLQTLDVDQHSSEFQTPPLFIPNS
ncbi:MAG TPA: hypothetical protein VHC20_07395 [Candidatus Paceibacterota bacterium]|nr:hypothetical protein [Candidatus Paceibacterota bacterium]